MRKFLLLLITIASFQIASAQCAFFAEPLDATINCDDSIQIDFEGFAAFAFGCTFDTTSTDTGICNGWAATSSAQINSSCIPQLIPDPPDNSDYLWMGNLADVPRELATQDLDVSAIDQICFDFIMAVQNTVPGIPSCQNAEGPDLSAEGVSLQYSLDGGSTWIDIAYFQPDGTILPSNPGTGGPGVGSGQQTPFTQWANYCFTIPPAAQTANTSFQWSQLASSAVQNDHWGIDNVEIFSTSPAFGFYTEDLNTIDTNFAVVAPTADSTYTFYYSDFFSDTCEASVDITVNPTDAGPDIIAACDGIGIPINVTGVSPWSVVSWTPFAGLDDPTSPNPFVNPVNDQMYYVTSNCGTDSIFVDVVPTFEIDIVVPDTICIGGFADLVTSTSPASVPIFSYEWFPTGSVVGSTTGSGATVSPNTTTEYFVTVTSVDNCVRQESVVVEVSPESLFLNVINDSAVICQGDTASVQVNTLPPDPNVPYIVIETPFEVMVPTGPALPITFASGNANFQLVLPFSFTYFGNAVSSATLSSNGWLSFIANLFNSDESTDPIPTLTGVDNMVAFAWEDLDPTAGGTVQAFILGSAPNRSFVVEFIDVPHEANAATVSVQVVLYESSGIIQINNIDIQSDNVNMNMVQGIENVIGSSGITIPDHNAENFTSQNQSWQFIPYNAPSTVTYTWDSSPFLQEVAPTDVNLFPQDDMYFVVTAASPNCTARDSVYVEVDLFEVVASDDTTICAGDDASLTASIAGVPVLCTEDYDVSSATFGMIAPNNATTLTLGDDQVSPAISLPFQFEFYCDTYDEVRVSSNGFMTFANNTDNGCCTGPVLPQGGTPDNVVALYWSDLDPNNGADGTISHWIVGTAPNRTFVLEFNQVPHWPGGATAPTITGQIHLYEGSNEVQIHCQDCQDDLGSGTMGLENALGTIADTPPGRNGAVWSATNEAWIFTPLTSLGAYTFDWNPNATLTDTIGPDATASPNTTTMYTIDITNANGCTYSDSTLVSITLGMAMGDTTICEGDTTQLFASGASEYAWTPNDGSLSDVNAAEPMAFPTATTTYTVTFNPNSCPTTETVEVIVNSAPVVQINNGDATASICAGAAVDLTVTPNDPNWTYEWFGPATGTGNVLSATVAGPYASLVTDENGCTAVPSIQVVDNPSAILDFTSLRNILCCTDDEVSLFFDNNVVTNGLTIQSFTINGNAETEPFVITSGTGTQTFNVSVTTDDGCVTDASFDIETNCINPVITDITEIFSNAQETFTVTHDNGDAYDWSVSPSGNGVFLDNAIQSPTFTPGSTPGAYEAMVDVDATYTLNDGSTVTCSETATDSFIVTSILEPKFPDAFSPNGDGTNDVFFDFDLLPLNTTIGDIFIYNRWGQIVYSYKDTPSGWDGKFQGILQPTETYLYMITIDNADGTTKTYNGNLTLTQ